LKRPDSELVQAACAGDVESFRALYERYYTMAVGIARSRLFDEHLAEDAAQEAFATACRRLCSLRNASRFPEWLGTICRRTASRMARSRANGRPIAREPVAPGQSDESDESAATQRVHHAIEHLSASGREVIQLHYFSGLTYEEIGRVLGISPHAVHGRLQRARRAIAGWLVKSEQ
jgi:RNA polymerase sigma-70 factor (ECF subfamily)